MMTNKQISSKPVKFASGGKTKMYGPQTAGPQVPGQSASMGSSSAKFASGGKGKMAGKQVSSPAKYC